ncbi:hypothetical protein, partial [Bradyrhizobium mercantei]|uniref:hypothetical protein n=1 Tax=Bradyrhizobium mercantei TaxID=1904807 RepID=UPI0011786AF7
MDTFSSAGEGPDVDSCYHLGSEHGVEYAILYSWAERDRLAAEGLRQPDGAAKEADVATLLDTANNVGRSVFEGRNGLDINAR